MLQRAAEAGVGAVLAIGIGEGPAEMHQALDICREFNGKPGMPRLYASAGIYPHNAVEADEAAQAKLDGLLAEPEVIACGEIGLDYYHEGAASSGSARGPYLPVKDRRSAQAADPHSLPAEGGRHRCVGRPVSKSSTNTGPQPALAA